MKLKKKKMNIAHRHQVCVGHLQVNCLKKISTYDTIYFYNHSIEIRHSPSFFTVGDIWELTDR